MKESDSLKQDNGENELHLIQPVGGFPRLSKDMSSCVNEGDAMKD